MNPTDHSNKVIHIPIEPSREGAKQASQSTSLAGRSYKKNSPSKMSNSEIILMVGMAALSIGLLAYSMHLTAETQKLLNNGLLNRLSQFVDKAKTFNFIWRTQFNATSL